MERRVIEYKNSAVVYYSYGTGAQPVICFHGYGEEGNLFAFLEKFAGEQYTFYSPDLPFHGQTEWNEGLNFTHHDLQHIIKAIQGNHKDAQKTGKERLILLGFSLGGRMALSFYQSQPELIEKIILLAPDGLKINSWYWFATQTRIGNKLFLFSMRYPAWFFSFLKLLNKLGFVNASVFKFVSFYIGNREAHRLLYQRWTGLRHLKPNLNRIKKMIRQYKTPTRLVYGKYDRIILPVRGEKFQKGIEEYCKLSVINSGHQVAHENHIEEILAALAH
jgi:pimeloyl-ACP methyl ester carboxylesterase